MTRVRIALCLVILYIIPVSHAGEIAFTEVAVASGLDFRHVNGMQDSHWLVEIIGAGVGVLDFDGDGLLDLWLVQGGPLEGDSVDLPMDRLFRNVSENGKLRFEDVTSGSGVTAKGYGMGIATGDVDNDGDLDVFLANYGPDALYENLGDGRFRLLDAGVSQPDWSVSASFADIDGDGWVDLYVANYVEFDFSVHRVCHDLAARPTYCTPEVYRPASDRLYQNLGGKRFVDVSARAGIAGAFGGGLGVIAEDFNGDDSIDFYVANDAVENLLWINDGKGKFDNQALISGTAVNGDGVAEASMGLDARDYDSDCDVDLFMTHLAAETNTLYENDGSGWFVDISNRSGVAAASTPYTGFGTAWLDADNDGDLDLFSANGAVTALAEQLEDPLPLKQLNQFWHNDGGRYREYLVDEFNVKDVSRGVASADLDNDGDMDLVVTNNNGMVRLYRNDSTGANWIGLELKGEQMTGNVVALTDQSCSATRVGTDGSYASASDHRVVFGLGDRTGPRKVRVHWRNEVEEFGPMQINRYHLLEKGRGSER